MVEGTTKRIETKHGHMLVFTHDRFITPCLSTYGELSPDEISVLLQMVPSGGTVVEVGANIGAHTIPLARHCAPGPLVAFEPQQRVFQVLCANLALNGVANVIALPEACSTEEGWGSLSVLNFEAEDNFGGSTLGPAHAVNNRVRVTTVDALQLEACHLLKIDVEGSEPAVLQGASDTINRYRPRLYVENEILKNQHTLIRLLDGMGYRMYWHTPLLEPEDVARSIFPRRVRSVNMVCLPKESGTHVQGLVEIDPENWVDPFGRQRHP